MQAQKMMSEESESESTPIDELISRVDSYIKDPSLVTVQTLTELKNDLIDLKSVVDEEEVGEPEESPEMMKHGGKPDLAIVIGSARRGK